MIQGAAPVRACLQALSGWTAQTLCRVDALMSPALPGAKTAKRRHPPMDALPGQGGRTS